MSARAPAPGTAVRIGTVLVHAITEAECVDWVLEQLDAGYGGWVLTVNLDHLRLCQRDTSYARLCATASLVVADGMPLVWASRLQGASLPERVAGSDLISSLTAAAAQRGRSIFLLGGAPGTADASALLLRHRHPELQIAGTCCPPVGFESRQEEMSQLTQMVKDLRPDIVYVALGTPKQDRLIERLRVPLPSTWFLGVGASLDFLSGEVPRAPLWMQRAGLEWLHRLLREPWRLSTRYLIQGIPFGLKLLGGAIVRRVRHRQHASRKTSKPLS